MISAVLLFGAMNCVFEFILLCMLPPRARLRLLGNDGACNAVHVLFLMGNLVVHWGTLIGTMSGIFAFICSMLTIRVARTLFGCVHGDTYHVGFIKFTREELR